MLRIVQDPKDKYRPRFCNSEFYSDNQSTFQMWKTFLSDSSDVEKVQAWIFGLSCLRRPNDWFGGFRTKPFDFENIQKNSNLTLESIFNPAKIKIPKKLDPNITISEAIKICRIKPLPEVALRSLSRLTDPSYSIKILDRVPTPFELLNEQANGFRVISFNEDIEFWPKSEYGERDFLSFILHDLVHADHFLNNDYFKKGQLGFYKLIQSIWHHNSLQALMLSDQFKKGFEYIISDMNAHPVHLVKTLKALLLESLKNDSLSTQIWNEWITTWCSDTDTQNSLFSVNLEGFTSENALRIEKLCFKNGATAH